MMRDKIIEKIMKDDHVSFVEVEKLFDESGFEYKGSRVMRLCEISNLIVWGEWNQEAIDLINDILEKESIALQMCQPLIYLIDGKGINLPIAKSIRPYKTERWIPMVFRKESNARK